MNPILSLTKKDPVPVLVKMGQVAKLLSVSRHTVRHLIDSGDLLAKSVNPTKEKRKTVRTSWRNRSRTHVRVTRDSLLKFYKSRFGHTLQAALADPFER